MKKRIIQEGDEGVRLIVKQKRSGKQPRPVAQRPTRSPIHVVYGGADRFFSGTTRKLGDIGIRSIESYAPNFIAFAKAMGMPGSDVFSDDVAEIERLEKQIGRSQTKAREENFDAWLFWAVYERTISKLQTEPVEDMRIDFEDGFGFRPDQEEDAEAVRAAGELAKAANEGTITPFCGFRIRSLSDQTRPRAIRTLNLFLESFNDRLTVPFPAGFVVTLPKITHRKQVKELANALAKFEKRVGLAKGSIGIEIMVETPGSLLSPDRTFALPGIAEAGKGRVTSAHFGAYDHTASLGIASAFQAIDHPACDLARQLMLLSLAPLGIRLADSVTTVLPIPPHTSGRLNKDQRLANNEAVHRGWAVHFQNITRSMANGFYQSWDLHPHQLPARYAAVYYFYLSELFVQGERLKRFVEKATQATLTGAIFDDAASGEGLMNFFRRAVGCGAVTEREVALVTGLTAKQLELSFSEIAAGTGNRS